jgi:3-deoxy-7-phosphoheptulonate synthase
MVLENLPASILLKSSDSPPRKRQRLEANGLKNFVEEEIEAFEVEEVVEAFDEDADELVLPYALKQKLPLSAEAGAFIKRTRSEIADIVHGRDDRLVCVVGPCSIHDRDVAIAYGQRLKEMVDEFQNELLVIMRVYFEKPRTTVGWKGLINDPDLNGTFDINKGMALARSIVVDLVEHGVGTGTEWLDMCTPEYLADGFCWGAIGARTTESQPHRQMVSGLPMPVGFKNSTAGKVDIAANACISAAGSHSFLGAKQNGRIGIVRTSGNENCHVIHRGGNNGPNYDPESIKESADYMRQKKLSGSIVVDCSHGNSKKDYRNQPAVSASIASQVAEGSTDIVGVMIESHIKEGKQKLDPSNPATLEYGKSITDSCVNLETTHQMLKGLAEAVQKRRQEDISI